MKEVLVDTDIISFYLKNEPIVLQNLENYLQNGQTLYISRASFFEIKAGLAYKDAFAKDKKFMELLSKATILEITEASSLISAEIYADLRKKGIIVQEMDLLNAGIALSNNLQMCTNNTKHYQAIKDLDLVNWTI
jgi:tRNA(fMet)-specific endonuclease VapC